MLNDKPVPEFFHLVYKEGKWLSHLFHHKTS